MAWGRDEGYRWFNLGLTPLAGPNDPRLAPLWRRVGTRLYRHGEHFDDPAELRRAKAAWDPVWSPRYLALPGGLVHARVLTDLAILIDGDDPDDRRR